MIFLSIVSDGNIYFLSEICTNKSDTYSCCITMKIPWYIEGMEDYSHRKNYPPCSHGFGENKKKPKKS